MRILITNDDGIASPALHALTEWAHRFGEVTVAAPAEEQSGKSHAIDFRHPMRVEQQIVPYADRAFAVFSTPADCVRFAVVGLGVTYDLVLSGINRGWNIGKDIIYSGTVGAVLESAFRGIPAVALSASEDACEDAIGHLDRIEAFFTRHGLLSVHPAYNVNIPPSVRGIRMTEQGHARYDDEFIPIGENRYRQVGHFHPEDSDAAGIFDTTAVFGGYISVTPLRIGVTDESVFQRLRNCR